MHLSVPWFAFFSVQMTTCFIDKDVVKSRPWYYETPDNFEKVALPFSSSDPSSQSFLLSHTLFIFIQSPSVHLHFESRHEEGCDGSMFVFPGFKEIWLTDSEHSFSTCDWSVKSTHFDEDGHLTYFSPFQLLHCVSAIHFMLAYMLALKLLVPQIRS